MSAFIDQNIDRDTNDYQRTPPAYFCADGRWIISGSNTITRRRRLTETFNERHGNCLSFTNLFVAMATRYRTQGFVSGSRYSAGLDGKRWVLLR